MVNKDKGITLIALVITIIVLLILAGIAISMLSGENGILNQAAKASNEMEIAKEKETIELAVLALKPDILNEEKLKNEIDSTGNSNVGVTDIGDGEYIVTFPNRRTYRINAKGDVNLAESEKFLGYRRCGVRKQC